MNEIVRNIAFFGFADTKEDEPLYWAVYQVAKRVAQAGYVVVEGGGPGVMLAAGRGAKDGGGKVIGVTLQAEAIPNFEGRDPENPIDEEIKTKTYVERTLKLMEEGDVYIIFKGGSGTISEFGMAWGLARLYFGHHKPLILYGGHWYPIMEAIARNMPIRDEELQVYDIATSPEQVLEDIVKFEKRMADEEHSHKELPKGPFSL
jgi:uncharacterized protein (TIGR00725 family)